MATINEKPKWSKDGKTLSNVLLKGSNLYGTYNVVTNWYDGTPMTDAKLDSDLVYVKYEGKYLVQNFELGQTLQKDTIAQMRSLSGKDILLLKMGVYKHIQLNGYYVKGDTPSPINYYLVSETVIDNSFNKIVVLNNNFKADFSGVVDVKYAGARVGVSVTDNTVRINTVINECKNALISDEYVVSSSSDDSGILMTNNSSLSFTSNGKIKAIPSSSTNYQLIKTYNVNNVSIINPNIIGDKDTHNGTTGEWGHGIAILNSTNVIIENPIIKDCWGDGIYIGNKYWDTSTISTDNIVINNPICDGNRRNGISVTSNKNVTINNPKCINQGGVSPEAGIDIEPEGLDGMPIVLDNIVINNPYTGNNKGSGIMFLISNDVTLEDNPFINVSIVNHIDDGSFCGLGFFGVKDGLKGSIDIFNPVYKNSKTNGIYISNYGVDETINLNIYNPTIKQWALSNPSFETYKHAIVFNKEQTANPYVNTNINIINTSVEHTNTVDPLRPFYVISANPNKNSIIINGINNADINLKSSVLAKGVLLIDKNNELIGGHWETSSSEQIVIQGRFLSTYTNKDLSNPVYRIKGNNWTEGQRVKFLVETATWMYIVTTESGELVPKLIGGNLSSNQIGAYVVLEYNRGKWYIVDSVGEWTNMQRTNNNTIISESAPETPKSHTIWFDSTDKTIKIRNTDDTGWLPVGTISATPSNRGTVFQSSAIADVSTNDAIDLNTAITLVNELKSKINLKLQSDRASGQQA